MVYVSVMVIITVTGCLTARNKKPHQKGRASTCKRRRKQVMCKSSQKHKSIISDLCCVVQVRLFRASKKTSRQSKLIPPIADRLPRVERIKTDIILTCILGVVLFINNLRKKSLERAGVNYTLKNLKAS